MVSVKVLADAETWAVMVSPGTTGYFDVDGKTAAFGYIWYQT